MGLWGVATTQSLTFGRFLFNGVEVGAIVERHGRHRGNACGSVLDRHARGQTRSGRGNEASVGWGPKHFVLLACIEARCCDRAT